ncbi:uncharacterized protein LOC124253560 [Haliotis rubra]|uniref:uncharacterized protein LOC124253560 n=1 Tax=Haliotis rubra TaxID=36100 RepID=UPI001EE5C860|nr:uncharacterized protein LOC124253560 [Haliotis rubra]
MTVYTVYMYMMAEESLRSPTLVYVLVNKGVKAMRSGLNNIADNNERFRLPPECRASITLHQIRNMERSKNASSHFLSGTWCKEAALSDFQKGRKLTPLFMWYKNRLLPFGSNYPDRYFQETKRSVDVKLNRSTPQASPVMSTAETEMCPVDSDVTEIPPDIVESEERLKMSAESNYPLGYNKEIQRSSADNELNRSTPQAISVLPTTAEDTIFPGGSDVTEIPPEIVAPEERFQMPVESSPPTPSVITPSLHLETVVGTRKRRPRTRGTHLNTDKKMWMSKKPRNDEVIEMTGDGCSSGQLAVPKPSPSTGNVETSVPKPAGDLMTQAFGYDPSVNAFCNISTQDRRLDDVQLPVLGRQQVKFKMVDAEEYSVHGRGASATFFHATVDDTAVLVKDGTDFSRSVAEVMTEGKIISSLSDTCVTPQLLGVLEQGFLEREYSLVLEDCTGFISLQDLLQSGYFVSRSGWTNICLTLSSHLKTLHSRRVLHNNISSGNIIINKDTLEVKLVGFGQASFGRGVKLPSTTRHHSGLAPEVRLGCVTSPQADVYALGCVLEEIKVASNLMELHDVVQMCHQGLPRNRPEALEIHDLMHTTFHVR